MYQSDVKEAFILYYVKTKVVSHTSLYSLFKKTEPFEKAIKKDCSLFSQKEILAMYRKFEAKSVYVLMNYNVILKAYSTWRHNNYQEEFNPSYASIKIDALKPCILNSCNQFLSREEITEIENKLYNWTDKAIIECLWEGISGPSMTDLISINTTIVDTDNKMLCYPDGRKLQLTDRLNELLVKAFSETEYICYGKTLQVKETGGFGQLYKERDNAHAIDSPDKHFRWVYRKIQTYRNHVGRENLTMKDIHISGFYYYLSRGITSTGLNLKDFLRSDDGLKLARKYGYQSNTYVDNLTHRFTDYF